MFICIQSIIITTQNSLVYIPLHLFQFS